MSDTVAAPLEVPPQPVQVYFANVVTSDASGAVNWIGHMSSVAWDSMKAMPGYVEIPEAEFAANQHATTKLQLVNGKLQPVLPPPPPLSKIQDAALATIDNQAEAARAQFLTPGAGQAMEYLATQADAERAIADPNPLTAEGYPWLEAERVALAGIGQNKTLLEVAQIVMAQTAAWTTAGAAIKEIRRAAKLAVQAATTAEEVAAILAGLTWPSVPS